MKKPLIGIVSGKRMDTEAPFTGDVRSDVCKDHIDAVYKAGGIPIQIPLTDHEDLYDYYVELCDGFLFPGGPDIAPIYYKEPLRTKAGKIYHDLDRYQMGIMKRVLEKKKPLIGICRGMQLLTVAAGGTLYQDLSETGTDQEHYGTSQQWEKVHSIKIKEGSRLHQLLGSELWVNSYHHQCARALGPGTLAAAVAEDGIIEAIELRDYGFALGLQWHPEMMLPAGDEMLPLFTALVEEAAKGGR